MNTQQINARIAAQLKAQRKLKKWSLDRTAKATGVSKAMLGQIERGESSPTIATLWKIATGLECSFSSFMQGDQQLPAHDKENHTTHTDTHMKVTALFPFSAATHFEVFEITIVNHHVQRSAAHQRGVTEHIHVLAGQLSVLHGEQWETVAAGEQIVLAADQQHAYRDESGHTRFIDIIHYPA